MKGKMMDKRVIHTDKAPNAIGYYSQAIEAGGFLFVSGQIPMDPSTGEIIAGDISAQTERTLNNLGAILEAAGLDFDAVVRCTIYLANMADFATVNKLYANRFGEIKPARATVAVSNLPKGALLEIDCIAAS